MDSERDILIIRRTAIIGEYSDGSYSSIYIYYIRRVC